LIAKDYVRDIISNLGEKKNINKCLSKARVKLEKTARDGGEIVIKIIMKTQMLMGRFLPFYLLIISLAEDFQLERFLNTVSGRYCSLSLTTCLFLPFKNQLVKIIPLPRRKKKKSKIHSKSVIISLCYIFMCVGTWHTFFKEHCPFGHL
jgi:hypothetical protein